MSQYVLSNLPGDIQDVLDWWVGPIGWVLPAEDQWTMSLMTTGATAATVYVAGRLELAGMFGGGKVMTHWFTGTKYTRDILRPGVTRVATRIGITRALAVLTMSVPTPLSLLFWTVTIATSLPPSGRSQAELDQQRFGWQTAHLRRPPGADYQPGGRLGYAYID